MLIRGFFSIKNEHVAHISLLFSERRKYDIHSRYKGMYVSLYIYILSFYYFIIILLLFEKTYTISFFFFIYSCLFLNRICNLDRESSRTFLATIFSPMAPRVLTITFDNVPSLKHIFRTESYYVFITVKHLRSRGKVFAFLSVPSYILPLMAYVLGRFFAQLETLQEKLELVA